VAKVENEKSKIYDKRGAWEENFVFLFRRKLLAISMLCHACAILWLPNVGHNYEILKKQI